MNTPLVQWENLSIGYNGKILTKIPDTCLYKGQVLHLCGSNGSGKSTLVKTLLKEIKTISGSVQTTISPNDIGYLSQIDHPEFHLPVTIKELLSEKIHTCHDLIPTDFYQLLWQHASGGIRRRALIAKLILQNKKVLILDEPFNHIDKDSVYIIDNVLTDLLNDLKLQAIIYIGHDHFDLRLKKHPGITINL